MCNRASSFQGRNLLTHSIALVRFPGRECSEFFPVMHHLLVDCVTIFAVVAVLLKPAGASCPQHHGSDPSDANDRIKKLENQKVYSVKYEKYSYTMWICQESPSQQALVQQMDQKTGAIYTIGRFNGATLQGGTDWLMVTYFHGDNYHSHCSKKERKSILLITCDAGESRGTLRVLEEFATNDTSEVDDPCYYLFELNNEAACTVKPHSLSPGSVLLIILLIVGSVYLSLGFLYQRFIVGAKGLEQIPNYTLWRSCGSLQADGCNYFCRCDEPQTTRYKTMDDALADDEERDESLLPV